MPLCFRRYLLVLFLVAVALTGFLQAGFAQDRQVQPNQSAPKTIDIVAVVGGVKISRQQLAQDCLVRFGEQVLENMVYKQLILNACQEQKIVITENDIHAEVARMAQRFRITPEAYVQTITEKLGTDTQKYYRDIVWPSLALRRLAASEIEIEPSEIKKRMDAKFGPRVQVRMIVLDDQQTATQIHAAVKNSPDDFGKIAKDHSADPATASMRGMMRPISLNMFEPAVEKAVFRLKPGEISGIVEIKKQYLIFKCERHFQAVQLTDQQINYYEKQTESELSEEKLTKVAESIVLDLQQRYQVINVYNQPDLRSTMPGVAATIGTKRIQIRDLSEECITRHGKAVLEGEINRRLLTAALRENSLEVTQSDLDREVSLAADTYGFLNEDGSADREKWLDFVTKQDNVSVELYVKDGVWPTAALKKLVQQKVLVSDEDLRKGFEANYGKRVEVLAIVLNSDRQAQQVWKMASQNQSKEFFGELANKYSVEPGSKENFGQVPPIARHGGRPQLEKQAFQLNPGELSGLINVGQQWIILKCLGFTEPLVVDPSDVREELHKDILEKKTQVAMNQQFNQIRSSAQIDNFIAGTSQSGVSAKIANGHSPVSRSRLPFQQRKP
ncbi:MAG: peptidylprolyl isomerase [Planctomycetota bacterium]|nr:peptidylprolyl isomerase [Planctomycetota bacterium]